MSITRNDNRVAHNQLNWWVPPYQGSYRMKPNASEPQITEVEGIRDVDMEVAGQYLIVPLKKQFAQNKSYGYPMAVDRMRKS